MKRILAILLNATFLVQLNGLVIFPIASASSDTVVKPIARYDFSDESDLGKDTTGHFNLNLEGNVTQGTKDSSTESAIFDGNSVLYASTFDGHDFTDDMSEFTISFWAKRDAVQPNHSFMVSSGVAYSTNGFGLGYYAGNDAFIAVYGNVGNNDYAANYRFPNQTTNYRSSFVWNFYSATITKNGGYFYINGEQFALNSVGDGGTSLENLLQTFTLGGVVNNDGSSLYNGYTGQLADVRIYDFALSDSQINHLYNNGSGNADLTAQDVSQICISSVNSIDDPQIQLPEGSTQEAIVSKANEQTITFQGSDNQTYHPDSILWTSVNLSRSEYATVTGIVYKAGFSNAEGVQVNVNVYYTKEDNGPDVIEPLARYDFSDSSNLGKDSMGHFDLIMQGTVTQNTKDSSTKTAVFNGASALVFPTLGNADFTDSLEDFTITFWAKRPQIQSQHSFMIGSGVAYSSTGFGFGYYSGNDAFITVFGNVSNGDYAANYRFPNETTKYSSSANWNFYSVAATRSGGYFYINGEQFALKSVGGGGLAIANLGQTFTLGGIAGNSDGTFYNGYVGELADVRVYDFPLNNLQINSLYNNGNGNTELSGQNANELFIQSAVNIDDPSLMITRSSSESLIVSTLNQQSIQFTASDGKTYTGSAIWKSIDTSNNSYALATGIVYKPGFVNAGGVTVTVKLYYGQPHQIFVSSIFTDNMLLQRNAKVKIFGYGGNPEDALTVQFAGQTKQASYTSDGWYAYLDPMKASSTSRTLTITYTKKGETNPSQTFTFYHVVVGELFLASGQSNMALTLADMKNTNASSLDKYKTITNWSKLRIYNQPYGASSSPSIYYDAPTEWQIATNVDASSSFSGFALAYAAQLQEKLGDDVPVGVIVSAVGGSCIEEWLDADTMSHLQSTAASMGKVDSRFYNAMIYNFVGYTIGGILWYQGEANASTPNLYKEQFAAYANLYRKLFENDSLPIIYMQLPKYSDSLWPAFRQAQWDIMNEVSNVYAVCGIDLGDPNNIHPTDKFDFASRAVGVALKYIEKINAKDLPSGTKYGLSPSIKSAAKTGDSIIISFDNATLLTADGSVTGLEGYDGKAWKPLNAVTNGNQLIVQSGAGDILKVQYLFKPSFTNACFVYNEYSLPVAPFGPYAVTAVELVNAQSPQFQTNLSGEKTFTKGAAIEPLNVSATVSDNGSITYQWFVSDKQDADGTAIEGATTSSYTPPTAKTGEFYYYVVATNTNNTVSGNKTSLAVSSRIKVVVNDKTGFSPQVDTGEHSATFPFAALFSSIATAFYILTKRKLKIRQETK